MMKGMSGAVLFTIIYIPTLLGVASVVLLFLVFFSPKGVHDHQISLLRVLPGVNGRPTLPSLFIGPLGSCSTPDSSQPDFKCTGNSAAPIYDVDVLPGDTPRLILSSPPIANPIIISVALGLTCIFVVLWFCVNYRDSDFLSKSWKDPKSWVQQRWAEQMLIFSGFASILLGFPPFLLYRMWFGKAAKDFNFILKGQGQNDVLVADTGVSGFAMVYTAYAFIAIMTGIAVAIYGDPKGSRKGKTSAGAQPGGADPYGAAPPADPFGAPPADSFGAPPADPFAAPQSPGFQQPAPLSPGAPPPAF